MTPKEVTAMTDFAEEMIPGIRKQLDNFTAASTPYDVQVCGIVFRPVLDEDELDDDEPFVFVAHFAITNHPNVATTDLKIGLRYGRYGKITWEEALARFVAGLKK